MRCSVVIATHNRSQLLYRSLWSILALGSRKPEEIVICDDGPSGDDTAEVVRYYAAEFPQVQISYTTYSRIGDWANPAIPRNRAIRLTDPEHEILIFTEPEMLWLGGTLETLMGFFENPPETRPAAEAWLPPIPIPAHFFVTASQIGYCLEEGVTAGDRWRDPHAVFGGERVDRRWPEMNTRLCAVLRSDVFKVRGWDERFTGWGYDDSDFCNRLHMAGANWVPLKLPVVHMWHPQPAQDAGSADRNHKWLEDNQAGQQFAPNGPRWGLPDPSSNFQTALTEQEWDEIQKIELESWTTKAWPTKTKKLDRERRYLQRVLDDLALLKLIPPRSGDTWVDVGCGPYSILELMPAFVTRIGFDPLHAEYEEARLRHLTDASIDYRYGRGEELPLSEASVDGVVSVNGLDHYQDPRVALSEMVRVVRPGGYIALHFCIRNASEGHPHPAHRIDLEFDHIVRWASAWRLSLMWKKEPAYYGWRHQRAVAMVFHRL